MLRCVVFAIAMACVLCASLPAQEFRVYTRVHDLDAKDPAQPIIRSVTLFHAGKVYDLLYAASEVTVMEPSHSRIWVVNTGKNLSTSVDFDELKHLLSTAEERFAEQLQELGDQPNQPRNKFEALKFQLRPKFETQFDARQKRLLLTSKTLSYEVSTQSVDQQEALDAYLQYADWACRLNYVLHPQPVFPTARLALNDELRQKKLMPIEVTLRAKLERPLNFQAQHSLEWTLNPRDRESIYKAESLLRDAKLQKVSLSEYQRIAYGQHVGKRQ